MTNAKLSKNATSTADTSKITFTDVESARQVYAAKCNKILAVFLIFLAATIAFGVLTNPVIIFPAAFFGLILFLILRTFLTCKELATYTKAYKAYFVAASFAKIFTNISYEHSAGLPSDVVKTVMTTADRYSSNDLMSATYKKLQFVQADVRTEERHTTTDADGHTETYYETIFKGRFLIFDFDRNFSTNLQVSSRNFNGEVLRCSAANRKFERLKTESPEFNKHFHVYAEDPVDALYILDPAFMEKIQNLYANCKRELLLTFINKKVYIAINDGNDSFEIPSNFRRPIDEKSELQKVQNDILVITNFVDSLNLDRYFKEQK